MKYTTEFDIDEFEFWSGAKATIEIVAKHNKLDELQTLIEDRFIDSNPTKTDINDFVWFQSDEIFEMLGIIDKTVTECNQSDIHKTDDSLNQLESLINGEIAYYLSQGVDYFWVDCGPWHIQFNKTEESAE